MTNPITSINSTQILQDVQAYSELADGMHRVQENVDNIDESSFGYDDLGRLAWASLKQVVQGQHDLINGLEGIISGAGQNLVNTVQIFSNATDANVNNVKRLNP
jgi:hypothetical protein